LQFILHYVDVVEKGATFLIHPVYKLPSCDVCGSRMYSVSRARHEYCLPADDWIVRRRIHTHKLCSL